MRCFVPNCENTQGVPFPVDQELKNVWLKSLNVLDVFPNEDSFVCLDHFDKDDIEDVINEENCLEIERRIKATAIPKSLSIQKGTGFPLDTENIESPQNDSESSNFYIPINDENSTNSGVGTPEVLQNSNGEQDVEIPSQNDSNSEEVLITENADTDEIMSQVQTEDINMVQENEGQEQISPEVSQTIHTDVEIDKQTQMEVFQKYQGGLIEGLMETSTEKVEEEINQNVLEESGSLVKSEFLSMESEFQQQGGQHETTGAENIGSYASYVPEEGEVVMTTDNQQIVMTTDDNQQIVMTTDDNQQILMTTDDNQQIVMTTDNQQIVVPEGQSIFTTATTTSGGGEEGQHHVYVTESGHAILTSEGHQVYVEDGQAMFTAANGQQVFVAEGQTLMTEDGQQVFLGGAGDEQQVFEGQEGFLNKDGNFQSGQEEGQQAVVQGQAVDGTGQVMEAEEDELELLKQHVLAENEKIANQAAAAAAAAETSFMNSSRHLVINEQLMQEEYEPAADSEDMSNSQSAVQPAATLVVKKEADSESARNLVMEWFVPTATTPEPSAGVVQPNTFSGILNAQQQRQPQQPAQTTTRSSQSQQQHFRRAHSGLAGQQRVQQELLLMQQQQQRRSQVVRRTYDGALPGTSKRAPVVTATVQQQQLQQGDNLENICRLCGLLQTKFINIIDSIKGNIMILEAIQLCIHPLEVSLEDPFSKKICLPCFTSLQKYYEFRQKCLEMNIAQRRQFQRANPNYKFPEKPKPMHQYMPDFYPRTKAKKPDPGYKQTEVLTMTKNAENGQQEITRKIVITPTNYKKEDDKSLSNQRSRNNLQVFKTSPGSSKMNSKTVSPKAPVVTTKKYSASQLEAIAKKTPLSKEKQQKIKEELRKVVEGKMAKEDMSVDQVIVRVYSEDDDSDNDYVPDKRRKVVVNSSLTKGGNRKMTIGKSEVVLPKGIRISVPEKFESGKGYFPCVKKLGAFDTEFSLIDGYLFEYRLCKNKERYLKCLTPNCPAKAVQKIISPEVYENRANVIVAHSHHPLTPTEIKKQMFFYIMRKRMHADKGVNFRNIYDQLCHKDPEIGILVPLRSLINEICRQQSSCKNPVVNSFDDFYNMIEDDSLYRLQFTYSGTQFYQERFSVDHEGTKAVVFANIDTIRGVSNSKLMYVDASFKIDTNEKFSYQLVTVLVWIDDSYYPIMFALVSNRTMEIFKKIFGYLHDVLAPNLCPDEIVTDYEANIYYALGETYVDSHIGGSVFYYTQNLYKKICELGLSKELETMNPFKNIYHMLLMLPLLPVNTIQDGLSNIEIQAYEADVGMSARGIMQHIREQWMSKVTPDLFCVHRLENRINENVVAPFKKLRDFLMLNKGKTQHQPLNLIGVVEKLIELENFLRTTYSSENKKSFGRDLSSSQKKNVLKAWQYIESHPKININTFFTKVVGYIKCMENQLWIWGYYKFSGKVTDDLINAANFSIVNTNEGEVMTLENQEEEDSPTAGESGVAISESSDNNLVMDAVVGPTGEFVLANAEANQESDSSIFKYVYKSAT